MKSEQEIQGRVCWQFGPLKAYELHCPYCEKSWCSLFLFGSVGLYLIHCIQNHRSEPNEL